jgi:hypothetical protein
MIVQSIKTISHSGRQLFYSCPRKFQLSKTSAFYYREKRETKALGFGKAFGTGIQSLLAGDSLETAYIKSALDYPASIAFSLEALKSKESIGHVHEALSSFYHGQLPELRADWEILNLPGIYGVELAFAIQWEDGIIERGFIDLVLRNKHSGEVVVLEVKTIGGYNQSTEAQWQNSPQGLMYLIVVDYLLGLQGITTNSKVIYLEYNKPNKKYTIFPFEKPRAERKEFLYSILSDNKARSIVVESKLPAFRSGNCTHYNRQCDYFGTCTLPIPLTYIDVEIPASTHLINYQDLLYANA